MLTRDLDTIRTRKRFKTMAQLRDRLTLIAAVLVMALLPATIPPVSAQDATVAVAAFGCPTSVDPNGADPAVFAEACAMPVDGLTFALTTGSVTRRRVTLDSGPVSWPQVSGSTTLRLETETTGAIVVFCDAGDGPQRQAVADSAITLVAVPESGLTCTWYVITPVAASSSPSATAEPSSSTGPTTAASPQPTAASPLCSTSAQAPTTLPREVAVGTACYLFDRLVPVDLATLIKVADAPVPLFAHDVDDPNVYAAPIPDVPGQLARYQPEYLDAPETTCPAEVTIPDDPDAPIGGLDIPLDAETMLHFAFAGIESDLSTRFLSTIVSGPDNPFQVIADGPTWPSPEVFVTREAGLLRYVLYDEKTPPAQLASPLEFAGQSFAYVGLADQPQTLGRIGCAGPFPVLAAPGQMASPFGKLFVRVGSHHLAFEDSTDAATPGPTEEPSQTGSLIINKKDPIGNLLPGACFTLDNGTPVCDNGAGDADPAEGVVRIDGIAPGNPVLRETKAPAGFEAAKPRRRALITSGEVTTMNLVNNPLSAQTPGSTGIIQIFVRDDANNPLGGACVSVDGGEAVCDDGEGDADATAGAIVIENVPSGQHEVAEWQTRDGYSGAPVQTIEVQAGKLAKVTFVNSALPEDVPAENQSEAPGDGQSEGSGGGEPIAPPPTRVPTNVPRPTPMPTWPAKVPEEPPTPTREPPTPTDEPYEDETEAPTPTAAEDEG